MARVIECHSDVGRAVNRKGRLALVLGILGAFGPLSVDLYLPGLPAIGREFLADTAATQYTLSFFLIGLTIGQTFYGPISDRLGRKGPLLVGCGVFTLASIGCATSSSIWSLIVWRFMQALGGCAGTVIAVSVVRDLFDARESARMYSLLMLIMGLAPVTAPLIGGQLLLAFGWRALFWLLSGFGLLCLSMVAIMLPETAPRGRSNSAGLSQALAVYRRLLADRRFVGYALAGGFVSAGMFTYIAGSPFVFIELHGVAPERYGWIFGANALGLIAFSQVNRRLLARYKGDSILAAMLLIIAAAGLILALVAAGEVGGLAGLLFPLFICVAGGGLVFPNSAAGAMAPHGKTAGSASALLGTLQFGVGASAGTTLGMLQNGTALPMAGVIAFCGVAALAAFQTLAVRRSNRQHSAA